MDKMQSLRRGHDCDLEKWFWFSHPGSDLHLAVEVVDRRFHAPSMPLDRV